MQRYCKNSGYAIPKNDGFEPCTVACENNLGVRVADLQVERARQGMWPSLNVGLRHQLVISGMNPYDIDRSRFDKGNWMGFEVGVAFPLFYGSQKAKKEAAKLDVDIARARRQ